MERTNLTVFLFSFGSEYSCENEDSSCCFFSFQKECAFLSSPASLMSSKNFICNNQGFPRTFGFSATYFIYTHFAYTHRCQKSIPLYMLLNLSFSLGIGCYQLHLILRNRNPTCEVFVKLWQEQQRKRLLLLSFKITNVSADTSFKRYLSSDLLFNLLPLLQCIVLPEICVDCQQSCPNYQNIYLM